VALGHSSVVKLSRAQWPTRIESPSGFVHCLFYCWTLHEQCSLDGWQRIVHFFGCWQSEVFLCSTTDYIVVHKRHLHQGHVGPMRDSFVCPGVYCNHLLDCAQVVNKAEQYCLAQFFNFCCLDNIHNLSTQHTLEKPTFSSLIVQVNFFFFVLNTKHTSPKTPWVTRILTSCLFICFCYHESNPEADPCGHSAGLCKLTPAKYIGGG